ncbi:hypothetical protein LTR62_000428 [Meristemomyces frigidus]|uniref:Uncharacterized protein n=1 Tax=Meristemomyces frigidus TaxID=1508187 RepID=A0AAN7TMH4_9PEZI|nr:hypothetical protein LTR62_000428 [Meristemomyces frigidus]
MGSRVFTNWQLWEKLCFFLGCAIILVVLAAAVKLGHTHWQLRRYAEVAEKERRDQSMQRQMSVKRRHDEVPFGIRALERGKEVEEVWVSRPTTPESHLRKVSNSTDIEKQLHDLASPSPVMRISGKRLSANFERRMSADQLPNYHTRRDSSPTIPVTKPIRAQHPPCSYKKWSTSVHPAELSGSQSSIEKVESIRRASLEAIRRASMSQTAEGDSASSDESGNSGTEVEAITASAPRLFTQPTPRRRDHSADLALMDNHRRSQVKDTGQLAPRTRSAGQSRDSSIASMRQVAEHHDHIANQQAPSPSDVSPTDPCFNPKIDALPPAIRRFSMPDVTPFTQFCQSAPKSPKLEPAAMRESSPSRRRQSESLGRMASIPYSPALSPISPVTPTDSAMTLAATESKSMQYQPNSFEHVVSPVVRGHGSGFEILKPGSLPPPEPTEQPVERPRGPPVSLHNSRRSRSRSSSTGSTRRKLQKKRQPSVDSVHGRELERSRNF